jgi:serine/threonine protein kinase
MMLARTCGCNAWAEVQNRVSTSAVSNVDAVVDATKKIGPWQCLERLGSGGNSIVWRAVSEDGKQIVALKVLHAKQPTTESYRRFVREVEFLRTFGDVEGVLPIIDAHIPESTAGGRPWLAMPIATPISDALAEASLDTVVEALLAIATTLAKLASEHGVGHRDVKPRNLYELDGAWLIGDFGLIDVVDIDDLTRSDRPLGPAHFTAYELVQDPKNALSGPADVYSLGKTLWALGAGVNWPPIGHQPADTEGYRISDYRDHFKAHDLDRLVDRMTRLQPATRPTMAEVADDLAAWIRRRPEPMDIEVADLRARFRAKHAGEFAARDLEREWRDQALVAVRTLQERIRPLNAALLELDPSARIDVTDDELTNNVLGSRHAYWGRKSLFQWIRSSIVSVGAEPLAYGLRMGRSVDLLDQGLLVARWLLIVGPMRAAGSDLHNQSQNFEAPVGTVQQNEMLDRFAAELREELRKALDVFVDKSGG